MAGENTRFFPLETMTHKGASIIAGEHLVNYLLKDLTELGITKNLIVVSPNYRDRVETALSNLDGDIKTKIVVQKKAKGQADAMLKCKGMIDEPFLLLNPYHVLQKKRFSELIDYFNQKGSDAVVHAVYEKNIHNYGAIAFEGDRLLGIIEKPAKGEEPSNYKSTSTFIYSPEILDYFEREEEHPFANIFAMNKFAKDYQFNVLLSEKIEYSPTLKYPWHILDIKQRLLEVIPGNVSTKSNIASSATVSDTSIISDGAIIGENVKIQGNSYIGKDVKIADNCFVKNTNIENNVVIAENTTLNDCLVYSDCRIGQNTNLNGAIIAHNVIIGESFAADYSQAGKTIVTKVKGKKVDTGRKKFDCAIGENTVIDNDVRVKAGILIGKSNRLDAGKIYKENISHA
jgi:NDP-sugar pyrophosphorylase family protein